MKAICALAIAGSLSGPQSVVAGLCGVSMAVLGLLPGADPGRLVLNAGCVPCSHRLPGDSDWATIHFARASAAQVALMTGDAHARVVAPIGMGGIILPGFMAA
jgi:hypothetical protein